MREHRVYPRVSSSCEITWRVIDRGEQSAHARKSTSPEGGFLQNISGGGLCFSAPSPPPVGVMLALKIGIPELPAPVIALGRAVWVEQNTPGYEVGVEFWWIGWQDEGVQAEIRNLITHKLAEGDHAVRQR
jgi:hypothetical protein